MCQINLQYGRPHYCPCEEAMEDFGEADTCPHAGVNDSLDHLTQLLHKANPLGVSVTLGDQD